MFSFLEDVWTLTDFPSWNCCIVCVEKECSGSVLLLFYAIGLIWLFW